MFRDIGRTRASGRAKSTEEISTWSRWKYTIERRQVDIERRKARSGTAKQKMQSATRRTKITLKSQNKSLLPHISPTLSKSYIFSCWCLSAPCAVDDYERNCVRLSGDILQTGRALSFLRSVRSLQALRGKLVDNADEEHARTTDKRATARNSISYGFARAPGSLHTTINV